MKRCHEQRFDEISAMYNLLLDNGNPSSAVNGSDGNKHNEAPANEGKSTRPQTPKVTVGQEIEGTAKNPRRRLYSSRARSAPPGGRSSTGTFVLQNFTLQVAAAPQTGSQNVSIGQLAPSGPSLDANVTYGRRSSNGTFKGCPLHTHTSVSVTSSTNVHEAGTKSGLGVVTPSPSLTSEMIQDGELQPPTQSCSVSTSSHAISTQCNCQLAYTRDQQSTAAEPTASGQNQEAHLTKQNLELENTVLCYTDEAMKGPIYSTPPAQAKTSTSSPGFIFEDGHLEPKPPIVPNPRDSTSGCGTQVQLNYFNINASSVSLKCRPPSARGGNPLKNSVSGTVQARGALAPKCGRPRTAPARRKQSASAKNPVSDNRSTTSIGSQRQIVYPGVDVQRAPLVPTLVSFDANGPAQCWNVAPKKVQPSTVRHKHVYSQWRSPSLSDMNRAAAQLNRSTSDAISSSHHRRHTTGEAASVAALTNAAQQPGAAAGNRDVSNSSANKRPTSAATSQRPVVTATPRASRLKQSNPIATSTSKLVTKTVSRTAVNDPLAINATFSATSNVSTIASRTPAVMAHVKSMRKGTLLGGTSTKSTKAAAFTYSLNTRTAAMTNRNPNAGPPQPASGQRKSTKSNIKPAYQSGTIVRNIRAISAAPNSTRLKPSQSPMTIRNSIR